LCMDWMEGAHLKEFLATNPAKPIKQRIAQNLWDFYNVQLHQLRAIHADPHPGNFLFNQDGTTGVIDFGCVKEVPEAFYFHYFPLLLHEIRSQSHLIPELLNYLEILFPGDSSDVRAALTRAFLEMTDLLARPFSVPRFHFTDAYIDEIYAKADELYQMDEIRRPTEPRGSRHALYVNRTYFGLYTMLADLDAEISTEPGAWKKDLIAYWEQR
ncbi:MAG: hypothetical protein RL160_777, partial [Bacteroidota bacterium]